MVGAVNKFKLDYNCSLDFRKWCARTCFSLLLCCWWNSSSELRVCLLNFYWFLRYCWDYWTLQVCIHTSGYFQVPRHVFLFLFGTCAKSEIPSTKTGFFSIKCALFRMFLTLKGKFSVLLRSVNFEGDIKKNYPWCILMFETMMLLKHMMQCDCQLERCLKIFFLQVSFVSDD
jgi:hypothetical protein